MAFCGKHRGNDNRIAAKPCGATDGPGAVRRCGQETRPQALKVGGTPLGKSLFRNMYAITYQCLWRFGAGQQHKDIMASAKLAQFFCHLRGNLGVWVPDDQGAVRWQVRYQSRGIGQPHPIRYDIPVR